MLAMDEGKREPTASCTASPASGPTRTLIVDDHPMFRQAFREVLARQPGLEVVADVGSVAEAIEYVADHMIDAAVVDIVLPEGRGVIFARHLRATQPSCKVLVVSGTEEPTRCRQPESRLHSCWPRRPLPAGRRSPSR